MRKIFGDENESAVAKFKNVIRWDVGESWFDRSGEGLVMYAATSDEIAVVRELLRTLKRNFDGEEYTRRLESRVRDEGYIELGIPGGTTTLMAAMMTASTEVVSMLLRCGANVESADVMGNDAFSFAASMGRPKNMQCWLERVKEYDLERQNIVLGATPLILSTNMGANKLESVRVLCKRGACVEALTHAGFSVLMAACANEDSDPMVVKEILSRIDRSSVNYRMRSQSIKWTVLRGCAKLAVRCHLVKSALADRLAHGSGLTALHYAARRGDVEIVKLLLEAGADPYVTNDMGMNAFDLCKKAGPFPSVRKELRKNVTKEDENTTSTKDDL